jgi:hypothetical protein
MSKFLGDKTLFSSMSAWGIFIVALGQGVVTAGGDAGFFSAQGIEVFGQLLIWAGGLVGALGFRRAIGNSGSGTG